MRYWTFKHQPGKDKAENDCKPFVEWAIKLNSALMQYEYGLQSQATVTSNWNFIKNNLKEGDCLFLRGGERIYAVGKIIKPRTNADKVLKMAEIIKNRSHNGYSSDVYDGCIHFEDCPIFYEDLSEGEGEWGQHIDVLAWKYYNPEGIYCKDQSNYIDGSNEFNVVKELKKEAANNFIKQLKEKFMGKELELLEKNRNLILTGAPGTGKTFLALELARKLIFGKADDEMLSAEERKVFEYQCCFVQFHPSYDYTDFVEGLRPANVDENGNVGFELKNGIFKEFCIRAIQSQSQSNAGFEDAWNTLISELIEKRQLMIETITGKEQTYELSSASSLKFVNISAGTLTKDNIYNVYSGGEGRTSGAYKNYMQSIVNYMMQHYGLKPYVDSKTTVNSDKPFVFIIDEINRGEISKIFGELFFSIDPDYRGEKGTVQTQYVNLIPGGDIFKKGFHVPENVYIIGTMNDIDRSVETFDFAMRRRFVWQEITAAESAKNMKLLPPTVDKMTALNTAISEIPGLNSSYHIGAAYFLLKRDGEIVEPDYESLWNLRLRSLLHEYLRGMPDAENHLERLHTALIKAD
jgi:DNA polymerase III delta prime subunit